MEYDMVYGSVGDAKHDWYQTYIDMKKEEAPNVIKSEGEKLEEELMRTFPNDKKLKNVIAYYTGRSIKGGSKAEGEKHFKSWVKETGSKIEKNKISGKNIKMAKGDKKAKKVVGVFSEAAINSPPLPGAPAPQGEAPSPLKKRAPRKPKLSVKENISAIIGDIAAEAKRTGVSMVQSPGKSLEEHTPSKKARKPMSEEQKARARANLAKARAAKAGAKVSAKEADKLALMKERYESSKEVKVGLARKAAAAAATAQKKAERKERRDAMPKGERAPTTLLKAHKQVADAMRKEARELREESKEKLEHARTLSMRARNLPYDNDLVKQVMEGYATARAAVADSIEHV